MKIHTPDALNAMSLMERKAALQGDFGRSFGISAAEHVAWIFWTKDSEEPTSILDQGSAFILDRGNGPMLVTAAHVYRGFLEHSEKFGPLYCQVSNCRVHDLAVHLIACGNQDEADIATFRLPAGATERIGKKPILALDLEWPVPPNVGESVMFGGFPAQERIVRGTDEVDFGFHSAMTPVTSITEHQISCRFNRDTMLDNLGTGLPHVGYGLAGISGGPLLVPDFRDGAWAWRLGGVISQAQPERPADEVLFESVVAHRAEYILPDGTLARSL